MYDIIETHCHLNFEAYDPDREEVIQRANEAGIKYIIIPGTEIETSHQAIALSHQFETIYSAVGIHPNSTADFTPTVLAEIEAMAAENKVVAIGEIGLDYHWDKSPKEKQHQSFEMQLELAAKLKLPVIIHNRDASEDVMKILEQWVKTLPDSLKDRPGVLHSFSAPMSIAEHALSLGFYLGFTGPITYKNAEDLRKVATRTPLEQMLVETDGPFLTPTPHRGKRNEPAYIPVIIERLASLKVINPQEISKATTQNAINLFHLPTVH